MQDNHTLIDTHFLIRKAKNKWQKKLAWIVSMPVIILNIIVIIYIGLTIVFGPVLFMGSIGSLFSGEIDGLLLTLAIFTPLFIFYLLKLAFNDWYEKKVGLAIIFIISNVIFYITPLMYGAYCLRYNYVEKELQTAEYDRCYDKYCNGKIDAYKNRAALFTVTTHNYIVRNENVGHSWSFNNYVNGTTVKNEPTYIRIAEGDTIKLSSYAYEHDTYMDYGEKTTYHKIPWNSLASHVVNLSHCVTVVENRGRYAGNRCLIECKYSFKKASEHQTDIYKRKWDYTIPKDSIMKHFFNFHEKYKKQYNRDERPWEIYMTEEDKKGFKGS